MMSARARTLAWPFCGVLITGALLTGCSSTEGGSSSSGACAQPLTVAAVASVRPGESLDVSAEDMWTECHDQGETDPLSPLTNLPVVWRQSGGDVELARVDADPDSGRASATVTVPKDAAVGTAQVVIGDAQPVKITIR
jgi:hypothetical protein